MKTLQILMFYFCLVGMSANFIQAQNSPTAASKSSFYETINRIPWADFKVSDEFDTETSCYSDFRNKIKLNTKTDVKDNGGQPHKSVVRLLSDIQKVLDDHEFSSVEEPDVPFPQNIMRDHLLNTLIKSERLLGVEFINNFSGAGFVKPDEHSDLINLFKSFRSRESVTVLTDRYDLEPCTYSVKIRVGLKGFDFVRGVIIWSVTKEVAITCNCNKPEDVPKQFRLENGFTILETTIESTLDKNKLPLTRFKTPKNRDVNTISLDYRCCDGQRSEVAQNDQNPDEGVEVGTTGVTSTDGEVMVAGIIEDCCDNEQANNTIGLIPKVAFVNNFEDTTLGIDVEYLHNMGSSFGNNNWFLGGQVGFSTSSAAGGELTDNLFSGAAIIENRTPILPCLQWVQRFCGQYGQGTVEAFGNNEDYSQLSVGVHTGFNIDIAENVSILADATILEIGSQTFTLENGLEQKADIGILEIPPSRIRFGVRLSF